MKIDSSKSREIYELATSPTNKLTNCEIAKQYGISEGSVRHHIAKWERKLHAIARSDDRVATALADHAINVTVEATNILDAVKSSIVQAKNAGISPEKLAPLYSNWIKSLELCGELLGEIGRGSGTNVNVNVRNNIQDMIFREEYIELKSVVVNELCDTCKEKVRLRLHELVKET